MLTAILSALGALNFIVLSSLALCFIEPQVRQTLRVSALRVCFEPADRLLASRFYRANFSKSALATYHSCPNWTMELVRISSVFSDFVPILGQCVCSYQSMQETEISCLVCLRGKLHGTQSGLISG